MKYNIDRVYNKSTPKEYMDYYEKDQIRELMNTMANVINCDSWYAVRLHKETENRWEEYETRITFSLEIEQAKTEKIIIPDFEKKYFLDPKKPLFEKIKACIKYLRSKY